MIRSVEIKRLRGIRDGTITDLSPLVVLVGPNGSGKSTILEAITIGASPDTTAGVVQVVRRHEAGGSSLRWLFWKGSQNEPTEIAVTSDGKTVQVCRLVPARNVPEQETRIDFSIFRNQSHIAHGLVRGVKNKLVAFNSAGFNPLEDVSEVHLVEAYPTDLQRPLYELYTIAVQLGRRKEALGIISEILSGVTNVEILTEHGEPILHIVFNDYSVPATLVGDGIQSLLRLSLELAASGRGVALLEEPEVHQHPAAIRQSARAIVAAVRRGIQVILTTHNLELIDGLLAASIKEDLDRLGLYRLQLQNGELKTSRLPGPDIAFARAQIEDDLR